MMPNDIETRQCTCEGAMYHSDDMDDPFAGDDDRTPFWQCEMCGRHEDENDESAAKDGAR